jgi:hypothetical protein
MKPAWGACRRYAHRELLPSIMRDLLRTVYS